MKNLITYNKAKEELVLLSNYVHLIETYEVNDISSWIIKNYALTNSIAKVVKNSNDSRLTFNNKNVTRDQVLEAIKAKPSDNLHRIIHRGYLKKIKRNYNKF